MTCPHCGEAARCVGYRGKSVTSLLGWVQLERHYYHCGSCGQGHYPWDETLRTAGSGLGSPGERSAACANITRTVAIDN